LNCDSEYGICDLAHIPYSEALFRTLKHTLAYLLLLFADIACLRRWVNLSPEWRVCREAKQGY